MQPKLVDWFWSHSLPPPGLFTIFASMQNIFAHYGILGPQSDAFQHCDVHSSPRQALPASSRVQSLLPPDWPGWNVSVHRIVPRLYTWLTACTAQYSLKEVLTCRWKHVQQKFKTISCRIKWTWLSALKKIKDYTSPLNIQLVCPVGSGILYCI